MPKVNRAQLDVANRVFDESKKSKKARSKPKVDKAKPGTKKPKKKSVKRKKVPKRSRKSSLYADKSIVRKLTPEQKKLRNRDLRSGFEEGASTPSSNIRYATKK